MPVNLREIVEFYRRPVAALRGEPAKPEIRRSVWCRIERGPDNNLTLICRWHDLYGISTVIGDETRAGGDVEARFGDNTFNIIGVRPFVADPRQFAELRIRSYSGGLPFIAAPPEDMDNM